MSSFTAPLRLSPDGAAWRTSREFSYEIGRKDSGLLITVLAGTRTDLGSIPRLLWPLLPPHDPKASAAFVLHDVLCRDPEFSMFMADVIFLEAMRVLKVKRWRCYLMFLGVRLAHAFR